MIFKSLICTIVFLLSVGVQAAESYPITWWGSVQVTLHTEAEAQEFFDELKGIKDLAWDYPADQCYARAYLSSWILSEKGVKPVTLWNLAPKDAQLLRVETENYPKGCLAWRYHVATGVVVTRANGENVAMVMDPAMANHPLELWAWVGLMKLHYPENMSTEVWSSHPYAYRKEDLGDPRSNVLLAEAQYRPKVLNYYWELVKKNRKKVDSPKYQQDLAELRQKIAEGNHPARQIPDPCPTTPKQETFIFEGLMFSELPQ